MIFILYIIITFFTVLHHEPWRDEAQAWLIARDLPICSIFNQMSYEGTPALWHIILAPFAKLGYPYISMNILHLIIIYMAVAVFIFKSPFSKITKTLFIFSYFMFWDYSIIARNYSISVLILFFIATFYGDRVKKPIVYSVLIFFLFNTNVHSFFIAISLVTIYIFENIKKIRVNVFQRISVLIMVFGGLIALLQLLSSTDNLTYGIIHYFDLSASVFAVGNAFFPHMSKFSSGSSLMGIIILLISCIYLFKNSRPALLIFLFLSSGLFYIFTFRHAGAARHHGFILLILIFSLWISNFYKHESTSNKNISILKIYPFIAFIKYNLVMLLINFSLSISVIPGVYAHYKEYTSLFSGSKEMARYIKSNNLTTNFIVAYKSPYSSAILPYLPEIKFWYADIEQYGTFVTWNKNFKKNNSISFNEIVNRINKNKLPIDKTLILLTNPIPINETSNYRLLYKVTEDIFGYGREKYYLYRN